MNLMMKKKKKIILIPYPAQGHVTPMLKLASVLSNLGFKPVIITPEFIHTRISSQINPIDHGILSLSINPHGHGGGLDGTPEEKDFFAIEMAMEKYMPLYLEKIVLNMDDDDEDDIACFVVDLLSSWAFDVARRCGVPVAGFWPAMQSTYRLIAAIPHLIQTGVISEHGSPEEEEEENAAANANAAAIIFSPNDPPLTPNGLPWLIGSPSSRSSRFKFWTRTLERSKTLPWILTNSFPDEPQSNANTNTNPSHQPRIFEIGPLIMQSAGSIISISLWEEDLSCLKWLDNQKIGSVVYISFGSWVSPIGEEKVRNLALALESAQRPFLWVLAPAWRPDADRLGLGGLGRVVSWAPQMEVLRHPGVGCYLTHCGWNSTLEGILCKKPFLCYPIAGDQFLNREYIVNVWKIGVEVEDGFGQLEKGITNVLDDQEMGFRIQRFNHKVFGKQGTSTAMSTFSQFIQLL